MRVVLAGGTGQAGGILRRHFVGREFEVVVLSRQGAADTIHWDGESPGNWTSVIDGAHAVINLSGRSVNCRYSEKNQREILHSRVQSTALLGKAIAAAQRPPAIWLNASTATIYPHSIDREMDEGSDDSTAGQLRAPKSWDFSVNVARAWEGAFFGAPIPGVVRRVALRSAMTMSPDEGGVFQVLSSLVKSGLGGSAGSGKQWVSWIHERDFARAVEHCLRSEDLQGPINICSPNPLPNAAFMKVLRESWRAPFGLPSALWMLEIGAVLMQTETELILKSRRVIPRRLLDRGFSFDFPHWAEAAADLVKRSRPQQAR